MMNGQPEANNGNDTEDAIGMVLPYENYEVHEYRFYNGVTISVNNTPGRIKEFADIQRAAVIFMSLFLMSFRNSLGERKILRRQRKECWK